MNLRLHCVPYDEGLVAEADHLQAAEERSSTNKGEHRKHGSCMVIQAFGPLGKFVLPYGHSRSSNSALVRKLYSCRTAARNVDYGHLKARLGIGPEQTIEADDDDDLPLDFLFACEVSRKLLK